ncbi:hypothetical protein BaRGS_00037766, partial [Batillaria attramentaria]
RGAPGWTRHCTHRPEASLDRRTPKSKSTMFSTYRPHFGHSSPTRLIACPRIYRSAGDEINHHLKKSKPSLESVEHRPFFLTTVEICGVERKTREALHRK